MKATLKTLLVEDDENDALLLEAALRRAGYEPICRRVETRSALVAALAEGGWDIIIADYLMPAFNGLDALALVHAEGRDLPFIIVSGHITDDTAVAAMRAGAHDYVMKDNLSRLGPAVARELREAMVRHDRRRSEAQLRLEQGFREAVENSVSSGITAVDLEGRLTYVNPAFCALVGWGQAELIGARPPFAYWPTDQQPAIRAALDRAMTQPAAAPPFELRYCRQNGERLDVLLQVTPLREHSGEITGWVSSVTDITERKRAEERLAAEHGITRLLAHAGSLPEAAPSLLRILLETLEADLGGLWTVPPGEAELRCVTCAARAFTPALRTFADQSQSLGLDPAVSPTARAWREGKPVLLADLAASAASARSDAALAAGLRSLAVFPISSADNGVGVIELYALRRIEYDQQWLNMMAAVGSELGQFIHRCQAEAGLRQAHTELERRVEQRTADLKAANEQLHAAIVERQRLERELLEITENERRRIGLDLHDDLGQKLAGLALMTKGLERVLARRKSPEAEDAARVHALVQEAMEHASGLARDLTLLDARQGDLPGTLNNLAARARELFGVACRFFTEGPVPPLPAHVVDQVAKIAQEAVTNAVKHGKASKIEIQLRGAGGALTLTIRNDGLPFPDLRDHAATGMGLRIMQYRASLVGATLGIAAAGASGTVVTCVLAPSRPV